MKIKLEVYYYGILMGDRKKKIKKKSTHFSNYS